MTKRISMGSAATLHFIKFRGEITPGDFASRFDVKFAGAFMVLKKLAEDGLLYRIDIPEREGEWDRFGITPEGDAALEPYETIPLPEPEDAEWWAEQTELNEMWESE